MKEGIKVNMIRFNLSYLYRLKKVSDYYMFKIINGVYLLFNKNLEYIGMQTYYNISNKSYTKLETDALNSLFKMGWINEE